MSPNFDPYYNWLSIPPNEQPPNLYRLLGLSSFESNKNVITTAADRQAMIVRSYQTGQHAELSQTLLNEISAAKLCLLDQHRKVAYDRELKQYVGSGSSIHEHVDETRSEPNAVKPLSEVIPIEFDVAAGGSHTKLKMATPLKEASNVPSPKQEVGFPQFPDSSDSGILARRQESAQKKRKRVAALPWIIAGAIASVATLIAVVGIAISSSAKLEVRPIEDRTVSEHTHVYCNIEVQDPERWRGDLKYELLEGPADAKMDPETGRFEWQPREAAGGRYFSIRIRVSSIQKPNLDDEVKFIIRVQERDNPLVVEPIGSVSAQPGVPVFIPIKARFPDNPNAKLVYKFRGFLGDARVDKNTGQFYWTPQREHDQQTWPFKVVVTEVVTDEAGRVLEGEGRTGSVNFSVNVNSF